MKEPLWQRLRRARDDADADDEGADGRADDERAEQSTGERSTPLDILGRLHEPRRLSDLGGGDGDGDSQKATYEAWADRMKTHKKDKLADLTAPPPPDPAAESRKAYWDSETLFTSEPNDSERDPINMTQRELLAILGITADGPSPKEIQRAYRQLAKEHHPDRWTEAEADVQESHAERMQEVASAYQQLKQRGAV